MQFVYYSSIEFTYRSTTMVSLIQIGEIAVNSNSLCSTLYILGTNINKHNIPYYRIQLVRRLLRRYILSYLTIVAPPISMYKNYGWYPNHRQVDILLSSICESLKRMLIQLYNISYWVGNGYIPNRIWRQSKQ